MLYLSRWRTILVIAVVILGFIVTIPNFISRSTIDSWPAWLPGSQIVLGLDLQGGAYLLYEVERDDYVDKRLRALTSEIRRSLLDGPRIGYTGLGPTGDSVQLRIRDVNDLEMVRTRLEELRNPFQTTVFGGGGAYEFDLSVGDDGLVRMSVNEDGLEQLIRGVVQQSIEVINRRINELGTTEPSIQRQGSNRILVEAPGLGDPQRLKAIIGQTAQLNFHMVQSEISASQDAPPQPGTVTFESSEDPEILYVVDDTPLMTGEDLADAQPGFDQHSAGAVVNFRLSVGGGRKFGDVTQANVGRLFAIVLDDKVISAPQIREPILGGSGQISGSFTVESANDLAVLLRAGALPAKLTVVEERTVGPGLGADSIVAGRNAAFIGIIAVSLFMIAVYGFFGVLANLAVFVNVVLLFSILTALEATLTLPGIAGVVLTIGTAVDSNVLIYERIREEVRSGRSAINAIDIGFKRALGTILDANITTFIAAAVLFFLGSGPIRGFAVTYMIGIGTTVFTAYTFTRLMIASWVAWRRPTSVPI